MKSILYLFLLIFLISGLLISPLFHTVSAQKKGDPNRDQPRISESAARQIRSLVREKKSRTPGQRKIDTQLLYALKRQRGEAITNEVQTLEVDVKPDIDGKVLVDIRAEVSAEVISALEKARGEIVHRSERYKSIRVRLPLGSLEGLAGMTEIKNIRSAFEAHRPKPRPRGPSAVPANSSGKLNTPQARFAQRAAFVQAQLAKALLVAARGGESPQGRNGGVSTSAAITNVGAATSEGDIAHRAREARDFFGVNGTGVNIGVLSDSVRFLEQSQASGDLPPAVTVLPGQDGIDQTEPFDDIGEGTAMLEIIHDLAPGAKLFFATAFNGEVSFADNIRALRAAGCDIIVDDVKYYFESPFQDDIIAQAVNDVTEDGALYFAAAGNEGNFNDGYSGTWEGDYVPSINVPSVLTADYNDVHDFGDGVISNRVEFGGGPVVLHWSDPGTFINPASSNDYDVYVLNSALTTVVGASADFQDGDDLPFEWISAGASTGQRIIVARFGDAQVRALRLGIFDGELGVSTPGAIYGHAAAAEAFAVAAVDVAAAGGNPFIGGLTNQVESFSADGPRVIFYDEDNTPITPGNLLFGTGGGVLRQKPDFAAADGVATATPGFNLFFGTSAAVAHAAAVAGLVKSAAPGLSKAEIRKALTSTALDIEALGVDRDSGYGIVMTVQALEFIGAPGAPLPELGTVTATPIGGDGDAFIEPIESGALSLQLVNVGGDTAANLSATLTTSTPGVTITQGTSLYPNIPPSSSAVNSTPFTFGLAADVPCGLFINFTLTVAYNSGNSPQVLNFTIQIGQPSSSPSTVSYTGPAVPIPDGNAAGVNVPVVVNGLSNISDLNFRLDGSSCTPAPGATTTGIDHTWVGDLVVTLTSPQGTTVTLMNRPGGALNNGVNFCHTLLDDEGSNPSIQSIQPAGPPPLGPPYTGTFKPANLLAAFDGQNPNGTWVLNVSDRAGSDTGSVRAFSLIFANLECDAVAAVGTGLKGEYYNQTNFTELALTRVDPIIDFDFGQGSPDPAVEPDTFSVRWTGQVQPEFSETYTFYTVSDDGVRLTVGGQVVIDNFTDHPATENSGTITLVAGQRYDIQMEFYESAGEATAGLLWSSPSQPKQVIPQNRLYPTTVPPPGQGQLTTLNFGELPFQPVNGLSFMGVTFGFQVDGAPSTDASYNDLGPEEIIHLQGAVLQGDAAGTLTLDFAAPTPTLKFGVARLTDQSLTPGFTVELFDPALQSRGITPVNTSPLVVFSEGLFDYQGEPVRRAVLTFNDPTAAPRFALDNLTYIKPASAAPEPAASIGVTPPKAAAGKPALWSIRGRR